MYPCWYERQRKIEISIILLGVGIVAIFGWFFRIASFIGFIMYLYGAIAQHYRFKRLENLENDPLRCECGGHFITPWELGFDAPADHLVCDNEHGDGRGIPCENWIVTPLDYHSSASSPNSLAIQEERVNKDG